MTSGSQTRESNACSARRIEGRRSGLTRRIAPGAIAALILLAGLAPGADATVPSDLCTGNPCNVSAAITVDPGSNLDFGPTTELRLKPAAILTIGANGSDFRLLVLRAGSIVLEAGSRILGNGDGAAVVLEAQTGDVALQGSGSNVSRILVSSLNAGSIDLLAAGNVSVAGALDVSATGTDGIAGSISITADGSVSIAREVEFGASGVGASGGDLSITAGTGIAIDGILDGSASGDGASVSVLTASGDLAVTKKIDVSGSGPESAGGSIDLAANTGNVSIAGPLLGNGGSGDEDVCGDGAEVNLTAGLALTISQPITANAGTECFGGTLTLVAGTTFDQSVGAEIAAKGPGSFGGGGFFTLQTGGDATVRAIDLTSPGGGGFVEVRSSSGVVSLQGVIDARATGTFGIGGSVDVTGCNVTVASGAKLDTRGNFALPETGQNVLRAGGSMTVAGQLLATSKNELQVRAGSPTITGTVTPAATIVQNPDLPDCVELAACGNGVVDDGEFCDDDNIASCDGCRADCTRADDVCGDGITECGEQCDDGNDVDDDGCSNSCLLPGSEGVRLAGTQLQPAGCLAEWELKVVDPKLRSNGFPDLNQTCIDGDTTCDFDAQNDLSCRFEARICLRVPDTRLPLCTPDAIGLVNLKGPNTLNSGALHDRANAKAITDALKALGGTVEIASTPLQTGPALAAFDNCTTPFNLTVPRSATGTGEEYFNLTSQDVNGLTMGSNPMRLRCAPNTSVCGNGVTEPTEQCDDGNANACDGCSPTCRTETCGDGIVQCNEQCDDGAANGTPGNRCSADCRELPPALRIPGGGSKKTDCAMEFSAELNPANVALDSKGVPKTQQKCTDNDPTCDFDPTVGTCRMRTWVCAGAPDPRIACAALAIGSRQVVTPNARAVGAALAARQALLQSLDGLGFPAGPGEICSSRVNVDVPVGNKGLTLRPKAKVEGTNNHDTDVLKLRCIAPATP